MSIRQCKSDLVKKKVEENNLCSSVLNNTTVRPADCCRSATFKWLSSPPAPSDGGEAGCDLRAWQQQQQTFSVLAVGGR